MMTVTSGGLRLSRQQNAVASFVCSGLNTDQIATRMRLSRNTVLNHLKLVYKKVGVKSREGLVIALTKDQTTTTIVQQQNEIRSLRAHVRILQGRLKEWETWAAHHPAKRSPSLYAAIARINKEGKRFTWLIH